MKFNLDELTKTIQDVSDELKEIDKQKAINDNIQKYGTFLDSKKEIVQLYILFIFFGVHYDVISQLPGVSSPFVTDDITMKEYDPD